MSTDKNNQKKQKGRSVQKTGRKIKEQGRLSIKAKLVIGFAIPLISTVVVGGVSYSLAETGMTANYEDSMSKAMSMAMEYLDFGFESAVSESEQLYYNTDLMRWATGAIYNEWRRNEIVEDVSVDLNVKRSGNDFVSDMYIIPAESLPVVSTYSSDVNIPGFYGELADSVEASCLESLSGNWIGSHTYIDKILGEYYSDYSVDNYACAYIRPMATRRACIVVDYNSEAIADVLRNLDLGEGSISAFITADNREILLRENEVVKDSDFSFTDQIYYTEAMADNAAVVIEYVEYAGEEYLFMVSKSYENGSAICAMVPVSMVRASADMIRNITVLIMIAACAVALLAGALIIIGISSTIGQISNKLQRVSGGDLTVAMNVNRRDEFKVLATNIADMVRNSRNLIVQVLKTTENVSSSTSKLEEASDALTDSNNQIAHAVDEIDKGLAQQSQDAQNCLFLMEELSQRITRAVEAVGNMATITDNTKKIIGDGMTTMDELKTKSTDTNDITRNVALNIQNLEMSLAEIEKFVDTINNIAEETSLLSLNASIEAAKAGESGRGFAVVAQSVGKLSDGTIEAAKQIQSVMDEIRKRTNETVGVAETAGEIVSQQTDTVSHTIKVFGGMNSYLENLIEELESLEKTIKSMERHRNDTLSAIESISSVSTETASSVSMVNDSLKNQKTMVGDLHDSAVEMESRTEELTEAVNAFKIE